MNFKPVSDLELKAMLVLWHHQTCCVHMVHEALSATKPTAYTTAQTILERLVHKGLAQKQQMGKKSIYQPKITKQTYATFLTQAFVKQLTNDFDDVLLKSLSKSLEQLNSAQKKELISLLSQK